MTPDLINEDTITAIATAVSPSGIGIVRISGCRAFEIADRIFLPKKGQKKVSEMPSHTVHYGFIKDGADIVDEVMLLVMRSPSTYTREDTVEIDCHGGVLCLRRVLDTVIKYGARPAQPGEFTKRAFLNGRIDLTEAESVIDLINSKNDLARKNSLSQLGGSVREKISKIRKELLYETAFIESALDDPEHVSLDGYPQKLSVIIKRENEEIKNLLRSYNRGKILKEGISAVIAGKPNAGKSTLLNALLDEDRAIVTDIPGTTRDALSEQISIGNIILNITDTAGIRNTGDAVEKIGVEKTCEYIDKADLVIYVVDSSTNLDKNDDRIIESIRDKNAIILMNKSDLETRTTADMLLRRLDKPILSVSAKKNEGIEEFEALIEEMFALGNIQYNDEVYITSARQKKALCDAKRDLDMVLEGIEAGMPEDFLTIDMTAAYEKLGEITGETADEDLINEIFGRFCVGK